jgi:hypothetical protein
LLKENILLNLPLHEDKIEPEILASLDQEVHVTHSTAPTPTAKLLKEKKVMIAFNVPSKYSDPEFMTRVPIL